jgi:Flp pilus assembly secretin CpaC
MMTEDELVQARLKEQSELYINTQKGGVKQIQVLGADKAYNWRNDVQTIRDVSLDRMRISCLGPKDTIRNCIPGAMVLYLDKNLLYSWDQYF